MLPNVPGFNFAKGNARKLLSLPLYALGVAASALVPRTRGRWVFGSGVGIGEGALELYRFVSENHPTQRLVWLARNEAEVSTAAALGITALPKSSARGLLHTLRAEIVVITHGFGDVNRYGTRGAFVVQLWHGIPLKLLQLDSPAVMTTGIPGTGRLRPLLRRFYRRGFSAIDVFPAASALVAGRLRTAFGLRDEVVVTGDPRDDPLSRGTADDRRARSRATVFAALDAPDIDETTILFAPTWRDGETDPGAPTAAEWQMIAAFLERAGAVLIVRPHPHGIGDYRAGPDASPRVRMLGPGLVTDLTPLLPAFDRLITDYSSTAYDYALTAGPIFFLAPDEAAYSVSRGLYEPYREFSGGRAVRSWAALLAQLGRYDSDPEWAKSVLAHTASLRDEHFAFQDARNTARVYSEITNRLEHK
jgi:CDP-glycerol glycerophosphotransferase